MILHLDLFPQKAKRKNYLIIEVLFELFLTVTVRVSNDRELSNLLLGFFLFLLLLLVILKKHWQIISNDLEFLDKKNMLKKTTK